MRVQWTFPSFQGLPLRPALPDHGGQVVGLMRNITCHTEVVTVVENTYRFQRKIRFFNEAEADCAEEGLKMKGLLLT